MMSYLTICVSFVIPTNEPSIHPFIHPSIHPSIQLASAEQTFEDDVEEMKRAELNAGTSSGGILNNGHDSRSARARVDSTGGNRRTTRTASAASARSAAPPSTLDDPPVRVGVTVDTDDGYAAAAKSRRSPIPIASTVAETCAETLHDDDDVAYLPHEPDVEAEAPVVQTRTVVHDTRDSIPPTVDDDDNGLRHAPPVRQYDQDSVPATIDSGYDTTSPIKSAPALQRRRTATRALATSGARTPTGTGKTLARKPSDADIDIGTLKMRSRREDGSDDHRQSIAGASGQVYTLASRTQSSEDRNALKRSAAALAARTSKRRATATTGVGSSSGAAAGASSSGRGKPARQAVFGNMIGGRIFVRSGITPSPMSALKAAVLRHGGMWRDSVSSRTDFLIAGQVLENGRSVKTSNKYKKALELRVEIIDEAYFQEMVAAADNNDSTQMTL
jgi:hypothetical protein